MSLILADSDVMENIWESMEKTADGKHVRYSDIDVEQLWHIGFVDTEAYDMQTWKAVFDPYKQPDGSFIVSRDQFMALDQYRYKGEVFIPFDPMLINEGLYTDEGLDELVWASIAPSCSFSKEDLKEFFDELKKDLRQQDGLILIRDEAKMRINSLLRLYPSPLRNLEMMIDEMITTKGQHLEGLIDVAEEKAIGREAARQFSRFSSSPTTKTEMKAMQLDKITKAKKREEKAADDGKPKVELRRISRSRKGFRG
jgi:hypothetical protein